MSSCLLWSLSSPVQAKPEGGGRGRRRGGEEGWRGGREGGEEGGRGGGREGRRGGRDGVYVITEY